MGGGDEGAATGTEAAIAAGDAGVGGSRYRSPS